MSVHSELREIEIAKKKLESKQRRLEEKARKDDALKSSVETFARENGYRDGKALTKVLADIYGVAGGASATPRRKRTKVTAELRDSIKSEVAGGKSKNKISKEREISYIVVDKMIKGGYDHL